VSSDTITCNVMQTAAEPLCTVCNTMTVIKFTVWMSAVSNAHMCIHPKIIEKYDECIDQIHCLKTHHCILTEKTAIKWN